MSDTTPSDVVPLENLRIADIYREQQERYRHLNETFYKMPPLCATIIGGLWYFAALYVAPEPIISAGVFLFASTVALAFLAAMQRHRLALRSYLRHLDDMDGGYKVKIIHSKLPRTAEAFMGLMAVAFALSVSGAVYALAR